MIKAEVDKDYGTRTSETISEDKLKDEYKQLQNEITIRLNSGKNYKPKIWVNRNRNDLETIKDCIKAYVVENKNEIYSRISIKDVVEKSQKKKDALKAELKENPFEFSPHEVKKLTEMYNKSQQKNIYPKKKFVDTPMKGSLGQQIIRGLQAFDSDSTDDEQPLIFDIQQSSQQEEGEKVFELNFSVPFTSEEAVKLINASYEHCKNDKDLHLLDELKSDIQDDLTKLKEQSEVLNLMMEAVDRLKTRLKNEIQDAQLKEKEKQINELKKNLGDDKIAEKFSKKILSKNAK